MYGSIGVDARIGGAMLTITDYFYLENYSEPVFQIGGYVHSSRQVKWLYSEFGVEYWSRPLNMDIPYYWIVWFVSIPVTAAVDLNNFRIGLGTDAMTIRGSENPHNRERYSMSEMLDGFHLFAQAYGYATERMGFTFTWKYDVQSCMTLKAMSVSLGIVYN